MRREALAERLEIALRKALDAPSLRLIELAGERPAIDEQREPWIPIKYGTASVDDWCGVVPAVAPFERTPGSRAERLRLAVKVNPGDGLARGMRRSGTWIPQPLPGPAHGRKPRTCLPTCRCGVVYWMMRVRVFRRS